ncbi:MAG: hypothetical protein DMF59_20580 [Acidobacteria bacterium]|nr:MAG: hypothetical protein DMF59_20580 [Acidobacteriota bacterium]
MMKRAALAVALIAGSTIPAIVAATFLFGCCVLPFHRVLHRVMPLCSIAKSFLTHDARGEHRDATPAPEKQQIRRLVLPAFMTTNAIASASNSVTYRSFITLGATRCDRDVGLRLQLLDTLRI